MRAATQAARSARHPDGSVRWEPASVDSQGRSRRATAYGVSVRQKVNTARKLEKTLRACEANIVRVTWADYNAEGAGRYHLAPEDYDTLHEYLGDL